MSSYNAVESKDEDTLKTVESKELELEVELQELKDSATSLVEEVVKEVVEVVKESEQEVKVSRLASLYRLFCIFSHTSK